MGIEKARELIRDALENGKNSLDLSGNQLTSIPPELAQLANLQRLSLNDNPLLVSPPPEIVEQGTQDVLAYLRDQLQGGQKQWVSKLLLVGQGGVGKTSLLRALRKEPFDESESTTRGIHIGPLPLQHPTRSIIMQLNAWDFGGQEIYHATHQFFLTNRSLFLLVWNARHGFEQGKLYYWLDTIKARAPQSPIIVVATWTDERDADIPLAEFRQKYPQVVGHYSVSNKTGAGIEELLPAIADAAAGLPLMGETWPANWLDAANAIRSIEKNHIAPNELWRITKEREVESLAAKALARWLHELGDILFFQDDEELNDTVILNPQWVTESISKVLESEEVITELGLFTRSHMNELWSDIEAGMRDHFLRLMERFDLSYRTLENRDISLVVERLSLDPPSYEEMWDAIKENKPCNEISIRFLLDTTTPAGVPTWFIARTHRFTTRTHWRYGALFADLDRKHFGLIQAYPHDRYLKLTVRGPAPHNFFVLLKDGLEVTLRRFPGINIERKVPCPGHDRKPCAHEFDLSHLESRIAKKPEIECPLSLEDVSVPNLLFGLHWGATREILIEQSNEIIERLRHISGAQAELLALTQREFTKMFRMEQSQIDSYCPNIFTLRPAESSAWGKILGEKMELHLYCQAPGKWHPVEEGGVYTINQPAEWLQTMGPYIQKMFSFLKYAAPLVGPWVGALSTEAYEKKFKTDIKLMEEMVRKLPEISSRRDDIFDRPDSATFYGSHLEHVEGAALRALRKLLEEKDSQQIWGGLKRVLTPEGHYLWLCHHHAQEYKR